MGQNLEVFEEIAASYIREDEHWGSDLDVLKVALWEAIRKGSRGVKYLDIGCGPGFHIVAIKKMFPETLVAGVDFSPRMLAEAEKEIRQSCAGPIKLMQQDVLNLTARRKYDVVSFLNNGLGNMYMRGTLPARLRIRAIRKIRTFLKKGGNLIISVYSLKKLTDSYGRSFRILQKSNVKGDLLVEYKTGTQKTIEYYSHWFTKEELSELLLENGFKIDFLEERLSRLVVYARLV